jgi:hypothetical protein
MTFNTREEKIRLKVFLVLNERVNKLMIITKEYTVSFVKKTKKKKKKRMKRKNNKREL